jgi:hypothetical protein
MRRPSPTPSNNNNNNSNTHSSDLRYRSNTERVLDDTVATMRDIRELEGKIGKLHNNYKYYGPYGTLMFERNYYCGLINGADVQYDLVGNLIDQRNLIAQWDSAGNNNGYNNGFEAVSLSSPIYFEGDSTPYTNKYEINNLQNGWQYLFILTAFDKGDEAINLASLESSFTENAFSVYTGSNAQAITENTENRVGVYPNPYQTSAAWDGANSRSKKIYFTNLPAKCTISIYTSSGDLVANLTHDASTYQGEDIQWFERYGQTGKKVFSGGEHAWDILSNSKGTISTGVYLFAVKDEKTGKLDIGKFAIIK